MTPIANAVKTTSLKAGSLLLDPRNSRIPPDRRSENQRALLHQLLEHEDVKGLASSIAKHGLFPNERLLVTPAESTGRFIVLEGNRRLAAIRLLITPENAPTARQVKQFRALSMRANLTELGSLDVVVFPNRVSAAPIIAAVHTRESKKRWSSLQQARFYREMVDEGQTPAEVAEEVGVSLGEVQGYLRAELLYRMALKFDYDPDVRRKIEDAKFPLTTLERFLESKVGRSFLGVEFDEDHGLRGVVHHERFRAVLRRVAQDAATVPALTRRVNDEKGFKAYIEDAESQLPETKKRGSFTPTDILGPDAGPPAPKDEEKKAPKPGRAPKPSTSIIPRGFQCKSPNERVRKICDELKGINIQQQRNTTGVMLRVLLEIALWSYLERNGKAKEVCDHYDADNRKRKGNPDWTPSLRDAISYAVDHGLLAGMSASGATSVRSLASRDPGYIITVETFNAFVHNPNFSPLEGDLRALWDRAEPMLEIILN